MTLKSDRIKSLALRYLAAQVVVFLWFGPYLSNLLKEDTRYFYLWDRGDTIFLLLSMALIACAGVLGSELIGWFGRPFLNRLYNHVFVVGLGAGLLTNLAYHFTRPVGYSISQFGMEVQTGWLLLAAVAGYSLALPHSKLVLRSRQFCQIVSPMLAIVAVQLLMPAFYSQTLDPLTVSEDSSLKSIPETDQSGPIYLFVFDEWSYQRTYENGVLRQPMFTNLAKLSEHAVTFHDAHSPWGKTRLSLPGLLFQTDLQAVNDRGRVGFEQGSQFIDSREFDSIFSTTNQGDYHSFVVGFLLPYRQWLGDQVDICRSYPFYPHGENVLGRLGCHTFKAMEKSTDPWFSFLYRKFNEKRIHSFFIRTHESIKSDVMDIIAKGPRNTFAAIHYPLPHQPFIFNADGSYRSYGEEIFVEDPVFYNNQLAQLDRLIGELVDTIKQAKNYDDALIIMTSDHTWRDDPSRITKQIDCPKTTHVPLIIKMPHQDRALSIDAQFKTNKLQKLIDYAMIANGDTTGIACLLDPDSEERDGLQLSRNRKPEETNIIASMLDD